MCACVCACRTGCRLLRAHPLQRCDLSVSAKVSWIPQAETNDGTRRTVISGHNKSNSCRLGTVADTVVHTCNVTVLHEGSSTREHLAIEMRAQESAKVEVHARAPSSFTVIRTLTLAAEAACPRRHTYWPKGDRKGPGPGQDVRV